jgi:hypothetical protein
MTSVDSKTFVANGGYLQKGLDVNSSEKDLGNHVLDLLPSRSVIYEVALLSRVVTMELSL